jgi:hypothetical protein
MRQRRQFYALCYIFLWFWTNVLQLELSNPPWPAFATLWASTAMFDTAYVVLGLHAASPRGSPWALTLFVIRTVRIALIVAMLLYALLSTAGRHDDVGTKTDEETRGLLDDDGDDEAPKQPMTYGAFTTANAAADSSDDGEGDGNDDDEDDDDKEIMELQKKRLQEQGGWLGYLRGFLVFLPYILPYKDRFTQAWLTVLLTCVVVERFLTILIPWQLGVITEALGETPTTGMNG